MHICMHYCFSINVVSVRIYLSICLFYFDLMISPRPSIQDLCDEAFPVDVWEP